MIAPVPVLGGAAVGLGLFLAVRGLVPARPDLSAALAQLAGRPVQTTTAQVRSVLGETSSSDLERRVGGWLAARGGRAGGLLRIPRADLAILRRPVEKFLAQKLFMAIYGLVLPAVLFVLLALAGHRPPFLLPAGACLVCAAGMFLLPDIATRGQAEEARADFRRAVGAYFDLVALERAAEGGPTDALEHAARVGQGWVFARIGDTLAKARVAGVPPWVALAELAEQVGVSELTDLADTVALAGGDGAAIYDTLLAKARSMRNAALRSTEKEANTKSETMTLPTALLGVGFTLLVAYPAFVRIVGG